MSELEHENTTGRWKLQCAAWLMALSSVACAPDVPVGRYACHSDDDCPKGWLCAPNEVGNDRCYPAGTDFSAIREKQRMADAGDAASVDSSDAAPAADSGGRHDGDASTATGNPPAMPKPKPPAAGNGGSGGAAHAAGSGGEMSPPDAGEPVPPITNCEPEVAEPSAGVFASPKGSTAADCGTPETPCATILLAMDRAQALSREFIYLETGTYAEPVTLRAGLTIRGGYERENADWKRLCAADRSMRTRIQSTEIVGVWAEYQGTTTLDSLTIAALAKTPQGFSSYGVFARGPMTRLMLRDVQVFASAGGNGAKGSAGATPPPRAGNCLPAGDGADAIGEGAPGANASSGKFDNTGYLPGAGSPGGMGNPGNTGVAGISQCKQCVDACDPTTCTGNSTGQSCGIAGLAGCGGSPAAGGGGGGGGGSSIGIYVWNAHVKIDAGLIQASDGGRGGAGGDPGLGGEGSDGTAGSNGQTCTICGKGVSGPIIPPPPSPDTEIAAADMAPGTDPAKIIAPIDGGVIIPIMCASSKGSGIGTAGGRGGKGSRGGVGGSGAGGNSYGLYAGGTGEIEVSTSTRIQYGQPGKSQGTGIAGDAKASSRQ